MTKALQNVFHWVHARPVAHVAWTCTALAIVLVLGLALPAAFRRIRARGNRAPIRILIFISLITIGLLALGALDHGYRLRFGKAQAAITVTQYVQAVSGTKPFPESIYLSLHMKLASTRNIEGSFPELRLPTSWDDQRTSSSFTTPVIALPADLQPTFYGSGGNHHIRRQLAAWQSALYRLPPGHVYVSRPAALRYRIQKQDILTTNIKGQYQYLTVSGTLPDAHLFVRGPAIIMSMSAVQTLYGTTNEFSRAVIFFVGRSRRDVESTGRTILTSASPIRGVALLALSSSGTTTLAAGQSPDWSRRLAAGALLLILSATLLLSIHGRKGITRRD